jgi:hypothetical protein
LSAKCETKGPWARPKSYLTESFRENIFKTGANARGSLKKLAVVAKIELFS